MDKAKAIFSIVIGVGLIGIWSMLLATGQAAELNTKPIDMTFHLINECFLALVLIVGGIGLLNQKPWSYKVFMLAMGLLLYSALTANGYYTQLGNAAMTIMFSIITLLAVFFTAHSIFSKKKI